MADDKGSLGEQIKALSRADDRLIQQVAFPKLDATTDSEVLRHFADVWWNLCLWEKQRADVLDGKASALLGLSSIASAVVAATAVGAPARLLAVILFLGAAACAVWALLARDHGGFLDQDVFGALTAATAPLGTPPFKDADVLRSYLREIVMQRAVVYANFKLASKRRSSAVLVAQLLSLAAVVCLAVVVWRA